MIMNVADGSTTRLPTPRPATSPSWSRDDVIAYIEPRGGTLGAFVQLIRPDGRPVESQRLDRPGVPDYQRLRRLVSRREAAGCRRTARGHRRIDLDCRAEQPGSVQEARRPSRRSVPPRPHMVGRRLIVHRRPVSLGGRYLPGRTLDRDRNVRLKPDIRRAPRGSVVVYRRDDTLPWQRDRTEGASYMKTHD